MLCSIAVVVNSLARCKAASLLRSAICSSPFFHTQLWREPVNKVYGEYWQKARTDFKAEEQGEGGEERMKINNLDISEDERLFLDGIQLHNVEHYELRHSAGEAAELTVKLSVIVNQGVCESE